MNKKELKNILRNEYIQGLITEDYYKGKNWGINIALDLVNQLDEPEITEEPTFLENLTRLFKKHGYDHLGQVALALENDLEISINKELPVIPQFVADHITLMKKTKTRLHVALSKSPELEMSEKMSVSITEANNIYARAWLDGCQIEKKPQWIIITNDINKLYLQSFGIYGENKADHSFIYDKESAIKFTDKSKAEAVALLIDGTVEEWNE